jgi:hypothetical protein
MVEIVIIIRVKVVGEREREKEREKKREREKERERKRESTKCLLDMFTLPLDKRPAMHSSAVHLINHLLLAALMMTILASGQSHATKEAEEEEEKSHIVAVRSGLPHIQTARWCSLCLFHARHNACKKLLHSKGATESKVHPK